jgi:hypothetical protein
MYLTNPAALWLFPLCLVPLLLSRTPPASRHIVSNIYLWSEAVRRSGGQVALRRPRFTALVALQIACIVALVLALAGPVINWRGGRTAVVFDVSASMGARDGAITRVSDARARVRTILANLPRLTRVRLILASAAPRLEGEWVASDPRLTAALDSLQPTGGSADLAAAIALAEASGDVDTVIVVSDQNVAAAANGSHSAALQFVRVGRAAENAAVTRVAVRRSELGGTAGRVLVALRSYGTRPRDAGVEIAIDGRIVHRGRVQLQAAGSQVLDLEVADLGRYVTARLEGGDALDIDDVRSTAVPPPAPIRVALIGPPGSFLERALSVNPSVSLRTYERSGALQETGAAAADVLVCDRCGDARLETESALIVTDRSANRTHDLVRVAAPAHPLAASVEPGGLSATVGLDSGTSNRADVVLRVGGIPAVTALDSDGERRVEIHLDLSQPDFVLSPAFPVLVANTISWLAAARALPAEVTAGEPFGFSQPAAGLAIRATGPDGRPRDVKRAGARFIVADTDLAGQYTVHVGDSARLVAVNPDVAAESDISAPRAGAPDGIESTSSSRRASFAMARWLMLLAFALLALEWRLRLPRAR